MPVSLKIILSAVAITAACCQTAPAQAIPFQAITLDPNPGKVVYAVTHADVDGDGQVDAVAVTEDQVLWYRAPDWQKQTILSGGTAPDNVCIAPHDIDNDGRIDFALGAGWPTSGGTSQWLTRDARPDASARQSSGQAADAETASSKDNWSVYPITDIPWTHRMRFGNVLGLESGQPQLVVSPLNATSGPGVLLTALKIPANPRTDRWMPTVLTQNLDRMHNHLCVDADRLGIELAGHLHDIAVTLTASSDGVHLVMPLQLDQSQQSADPSTQQADPQTAQPQLFRQIKLFAGASGDKPAERGAGEIRMGQLADGELIFATIEPMHGSDAVVYEVNRQSMAKVPSVQAAEADGSETPDFKEAKRVLLTDELRGGHALACVDLDRDGSDEVVVGSREAGPKMGLLYYDRDSAGGWTEYPLDIGGMACEDISIADFDGDGRPDVLAGGRATHNVRLYLNRGKQPTGRSSQTE